MADLRIRNLYKSFGNTKVIDNISFDVNQGEFCILLGPSGCGKTTVLRLIAGLDEQDKGEIFIGEREVSGLTPKERNIAMVFQSYALYPHMTVYENMAFSLKMQKQKKPDIDVKVKNTAELLGIEDLLHRKPKELSGGQRQRVAIGRAIVRNPRLFLFDEPLSNLDAKLRSIMRVELAALHQKLKATTLYVTHDQVEAMTLGEKIVLFDRGVIQQVGTPEEMYHKPANLFVATFIGTPQINLVKGILSVSGDDMRLESDGIEIRLRTRNALKNYDKREITMGIRPEALMPGRGLIRGQVEMIEHLGPESLIYVRINTTRLIARGTSDYQGRAGDEISLELADTGVQFFQNNNRISLP